MIEDADLVQLLPAGHSVGSIRTRRPLMYVFSGGNEDAAFFSVNGFSILLDGGDRKDVPYWNLIRNYDKISTAVITRVSAKCLCGISAILMRKCLEECHPNFGAIICNLPPPNTVNGNSETAKVLRGMFEGLRSEGLKPIEAFANVKMEAITLYEVIGEGALRMIVLNPERGSKDIASLANALKIDENIEKYAAATSLALLLVWHPADHSIPVTRILIPGACPLEKLYASLEKLKNEEYLRYPEFTLASKDKPTTGRIGKVVGKSSLGKTTPNHPTSRPTHVVSATSPVSEPSLKKVVKQPLTGAVLSRVNTNSKKPAAQVTTKTVVASGNKSLTPENKSVNRAGKPGANGVKKGAVSGPKPKEGEKGKVKPVEQETEMKIPEPKEQIHQPSPASTELPQLDLPKELEMPEVAPDVESPQNPTSPPLHDDSPSAKSPPSLQSPEMPKSPFTAQVPENSGLLDGIEEPMQVRRISMDFSNEDRNLIWDIKEKKTELQETEFDLGNSATLAQETPLLDSTPLTPSPPLATRMDGSPQIGSPVKEDLSSVDAQDGALISPQIGPPVKEDFSSIDEEDGTLKREFTKRTSIQGLDLLGAGTSPFTAGLISGIIDDSPVLLQELPPMNVDESKTPKSPLTPPSLDSNDASEVAHNGKTDENDEQKPFTPSGIERETFSLRSAISSDSVNAVPDPVLDEVIDSLANASEMVDNAKILAAEMETNSDFTAQLMDNVKMTTSPAAIKDTLDERITVTAHDINDNANALAKQNAYEEMHAKEMYLPPMTSTIRTRAKPVVNGVKTKPKLSQPLYFDIVFVPHHGAQPTLKDEESAKAFVTSIRSRRYILSGKDAIRTYFIDGLIAGKTAWNKPELEVDVLPTHDSNKLSLYSHEKAGEMAESGISLRCSVERCTLRLSSGGTDDVCAAFKFEM